MTLLNIYDKHYKKLLIIPFALLVLSLVVIGAQIAKTGDFVNKGVSIKGGLTLTIPEKTTDTLELQNQIKSNFPDADVTVRDLRVAGQKSGLIIDASDISSVDLLNEVKSNIGELNKDEYTLEEIGSALGDAFFKQTLIAVVIAFLFMAGVVFLYFRSIVPSFAIILAAASDMIITLAIFNLLGHKLSTAGIAAFLMLIGYSVDSNILLSTKVWKGTGGTVLERIVSASKTGLMMLSTTIIALIVALVFTQSEVLKQIMIILLIGLFVDLINTWIQNAGILRYYLEKKQSEA